MAMSWPLQIADLLAPQMSVGSVVNVSGWVRSRRDSKAGFSFLSLHDGSCFEAIQVVAPAELPNYQADVLRLGAGCSISLRGTLVASQGKEQAIEIQAEHIEVLGWVDDPEHYPIAKKRHSFEFLRGVAHLRPRTNTFAAMTRVRHSAAQAIHEFFSQQRFYWVNTPILTASDCEGAGELFQVTTLGLDQPPRTAAGKVDYDADFFSRQAFLTVSGQLNGEAFCSAMSRIYTFGPTFRAENSHTTRHLAEFWMVEPEMAFADLDMNAALAEAFLQHVVTAVMASCEAELAFFDQHISSGLLARLRQVAESGFVRMDYTDAIQILQDSGQAFEYKPEWGIDLQTEHERFLAEQYIKGPLVLMNYPQAIKAFYMRANDDGKTCAAMDVLAPGIGEIIGGSQREERFDVLNAKMSAHGIGSELDWYRDLRRYGSVPHAGFGLGFERLLNYLTGMENIRDAIPFPRTPGQISY